MALERYYYYTEKKKIHINKKNIDCGAADVHGRRLTTFHQLASLH